MKYIALLNIIVFILLITIAGCGRKGDPRPPEGIVNANGLNF